MLNASIKVTTLVNPKNGQRVTFLPMIHVGPEAYYQACNGIIRRHKGAVIYESVRTIASNEVLHLSFDQLRMRQNFKTFQGDFQQTAELLGWSEQIRVLDLSGANCSACDASEFELLNYWEEIGAQIRPNIKSQKIETLLNRYGISTNSPRALRGVHWLLARWCDIRKLGYNRSLRKGIVDYRDRRLVDQILRLNTNEDILVVYGLGHAKGVLGGLQRHGYKQRKHTHLDYYSASLLEAVLGVIAFTAELLISATSNWLYRLKEKNNPEPPIELDLTEIDRV